MTLDPLPSPGYNTAPMGRTIQRPDEPGPAVGDRIRAAREKTGLSQGQAADRHVARPSAQYWSDVERGRRVPSLEWLWEAAKAIGCNPHSLDDRLASRRWPKD